MKYSIDELAKKYALTNEQLLDYLLVNNIDAIDDLDTLDLNDQNIKNILNKLSIKKTSNHNNKTSLQEIEIEGLFGKYDYSINFHNDISIWISENGIGKTTILNILVAILNCDQKTLMDIKFKLIKIKINKKVYTINKEQYFQVTERNDKYSEKIEYLIAELSMYIPRVYAIKIRNDYIHKKYIDIDLLDDISLKFFNNDTNRDKRLIFLIHELKELQYKDLSELLYDIKNSLHEDILFYPTYRRIEVSLDKIFFNKFDKYNRYELSTKYMGFGMNDVKNRINNLLNKMRKDANSAYIEMNADIISELLKENIKHYIGDINIIDTHKVDVIIKRIGEERIENIKSLKDFLDPSHKKNLSPNTDFLLYYLKKLVKIYDAQKPLDTKLSQFAEVCSKYLSNKKIIYDEVMLTMNIYGSNNEKIDFDDLSSGEKQIISIFSKVYLDVLTPCIFIIDEPEISLSIEWQKEFLKDIYASKKIGLLIATTHSPFIFKNDYRDFVVELEKYTEV